MRRRFRCGWCLRLGHTRKVCPKARRVRRPKFDASNAGYQANRAAELCDWCGAKSKTVYCQRCTKARKLRRKLSGEYTRRPDRSREYAARRRS